MITYQEIDSMEAALYDQIEMIVDVKEIYEVQFADLNGISFQKKPTPYSRKDFTKWDNYTRWKQKFDLTNWHFFVAFDGEKPIGGAVLCRHSKEIHMLDGHVDMGVLWDIFSLTNSVENQHHEKTSLKRQSSRIKEVFSLHFIVSFSRFLPFPASSK